MEGLGASERRDEADPPGPGPRETRAWAAGGKPEDRGGSAQPLVP